MVVLACERLAGSGDELLRLDRFSSIEVRIPQKEVTLLVWLSTEFSEAALWIQRHALALVTDGS